MPESHVPPPPYSISLPHVSDPFSPFAGIVYVRHNSSPVAAESAGATIRGFSEEKEKGNTYYEVELVANGRGRDVLMDKTGAIVEVEAEVAMDGLPAAVKDGLKAKAGKGKIDKVESITKHEKLVAYEAVVVTDRKKSEIQVGPDGKSLDHEE